MKLEKQRELGRLNREIKAAQKQLCVAFEALDRLHRERGNLLYADDELALKMARNK